MSNRSTVLVLAAALVCGLATTTSAQDNNRARIVYNLSSADTNQNMQLEEAELDAAMSSIRQNWEKYRAYVIRRFDFDLDGKMDAAEREIFLETKRIIQLYDEYDRLDADNDGVISDAEAMAERDRLWLQFQKHNADILAKYDANKNGVIEEAERPAKKEDAK